MKTELMALVEANAYADLEGVDDCGASAGMASAWLSFGGGIRYVGGNESNGISAITNSLLTYRVDGHTVGDLSLGYDFDRFSLRITARNVTNEEYYSVCLVRGDCYPGEKRSINGSLTVKF